MRKLFDVAHDPLIEMFEYLDRLRESGVTNMLGASSYLARQFDLGRDQAGGILIAWMDTFDGTSGASERAAKAIVAGGLPGGR